MRKLAIFLTIISGSAYGATDYNCQNNCLNKGYQYGYCQSACSYNSQPSYNTIKQTDYQCMSSCQSGGNMYQYCKQACSY